MELGEIVEDFLPPPADLIPKGEMVQVTLELTEESVDFFKAQAVKKQIPYQKIIGLLVDQYAQQHLLDSSEIF